MRARTRGFRRTAALLAVLGALLAGCTGVPTDSSPNVIKTVPIAGENGQPAATTPAPGTPPNTLVADFLQANTLDASQQTSPRGFLSKAARNSWSDTAVTVVDKPMVGFYHPHQSNVVVEGHQVGTVSATGVYTPTPQGTTSVSKFKYGVRQIKGQFRITSLRNGLLLSESDFLSYYTQRPVYFFDLNHHYLVPDPRWTPLTDPTQLGDFLMSGLISGPSDAIANDVSADAVPQRATAGRTNVSLGSSTTSTTKVEIPGSSQLGSTDRTRLAQQVAATLSGVGRINRLKITDGGKAVTVPAVHRSEFAASDFPHSLGPLLPAPDVYFLRSGKIYGRDDKRIAGLANRQFFLLSIALAADDDEQSTLDIAATAAAGATTAQSRLLVGTQYGGLRSTTVRGQLTRPAFAPGRSEVWVGDGDKIYLVAVDNEKKTQKVLRVGLNSDAGGGRIVALRLSPDGSRIALVIKAANGLQQLFVGAVMRNAGQVSIGSLQPVSPEGVMVQDVGWVEPLKLQAIGVTRSTQEHHLYTVGADGSLFGTQALGNLPGPPTSLAVAVHQTPWVTTNATNGKAVWEQGINNVWLSPGPETQTDGYDPVYLE